MESYRTRLREQGLRPVQIWVPDQKSPGFRDELKRQIEKLDPRDERDALDFIDRVAESPER